MVSVNISPIKLLNTTLMTTFGTTGGREGFDAALIHGFNLHPLFLKTLQASNDLCRLGNLLVSLPYFLTVQKESKYKITEEDGQLHRWEEVGRKGRSTFEYDLHFRPLKALAKVAGVVSVSHLILKLAAQFFGLKVSFGNGQALMAIEHGLKALQSLHYLYHLNEDKSRSVTKGGLNLLSEGLLTVCSLSENRFLWVCGGLLQVATNGFIQTRKEAKKTAREELINKLPDVSIDPAPEDGWSVVHKFLFRLFQTPYFVLSLGDAEQLARTLFFIDRSAESLSALFGVKKHPIFSYLSLAGSGLYGLLFHWYVIYWTDEKGDRSWSGLLYQGIGLCDSLLFFKDQGLIDVTKQVGKILIVKSVFMTIMCSIIIFNSLRGYFDETEALKKEKLNLDGVNSLTKLVLTINSATTHYGKSLSKIKTIFIGTLYGLNQIARGLYWQRLKDKENFENQKKLANSVGNGVQKSFFSSDRKELAGRCYL